MPSKRNPEQQSLFGEPSQEAPAPVRRKGVQPQPQDAATAALGQQLPKNLRLGTSSWAFPGWRGLVYTAQSPATKLSKDGLAAYSQHPLFRTVGVDRTFYAPIGASTFASYANAVGADFRFLVKAWSNVTSPTREWPEKGPSPHFLDAAVANDRIVAPAAIGLGAKLGVVLFQFPPQAEELTKSPQRFADRLHQFFTALGGNVPRAVELRDRELLTPELFQALASTGTHYCFAVHPNLPNLAHQRELAPSTGPLFVRWLLHPGLRYRQAQQRFDPFTQIVEPDPGTRNAVRELIASAIPAAREVLAIANNKAEGSAPHTIVQLAQSLAQGAVSPHDPTC